MGNDSSNKVLFQLVKMQRKRARKLAGDLGVKMAKGLLLGAGFSFDLGMPLASEFSDTLFSYFDLQKMTDLINNMRDHLPYGNNRPLCSTTLDKVIEIVKCFYRSDNRNYEKLFADIEQLRGNAVLEQTVHYFLSVLRSIVNELFLIYQVETYPIYLLNKEKYQWILDEFTDDELWVLTLNHDVLVEMLCIDYGIPLREGYSEVMEIPASNRELGKMIAFGCISAMEKRIDSLHYFHSSKGINVLKIHGGLNEFLQGDDKTGRKRMLFSMSDIHSSGEYLSRIEQFIHTPHYYIQEEAIRVGSEICFSDVDGEMQFMQPSILTGSKKYHQTLSAYPREEKMELFSSALERIDELFIIGYSFGDKHINNRIVHAMHLNNQMRVCIVNPVYKQEAIFDPFDYGLRVRYCSAPFPVWADHEQTGKWDSDFRKHMEKMTSELRNPFLSTIKSRILREL